MSAPFIFVGTHRVKPGKRAKFTKYFTDVCTGIVEPNEPRLHSFFGYAAPDSDVVTVVQVHPEGVSTLENLSTAERVRIAAMDEVGPQIERWLMGIDRAPPPAPPAASGDENRVGG